MAALVFWAVIGCAHVIKKQRNKRLYRYAAANINPAARRETRVLTLAPGSFLDDLSGEIHPVSLDAPEHTPYEAVSYAWGSNTTKTDYIKIAPSGRRLWVPFHVATMLRHLRNKDHPRTLWVDLVSIDQENLEEKAGHVAMMRDVFEAAERVVVWLGQEGNDSSNALSILEELGWMVEFDFENNRMRPSVAGAIEPHWADPTKHLPYDQEELWSIYQLVHRPWFGRVWPRLEISSATDSGSAAPAVVVCGHRTISWTLLRTALVCIANKPRHYLDQYEDSLPELRFARRYEMVLFMCQPGGRRYTFPELLDQSRKFNCADPRDRVYTALSLASDVDAAAMDLYPDYGLSKARVFQDAVLRYIECVNDANILASCEATANPSSPGLPSWCPDWCVKRAANTMPGHLASSFSGAHVEALKDDGILKVSGVRCATVKTVHSLFADFVPVPEVVAAIKRCAPPDVLTALYQDKETGLLEAYCAALAWDLFDSRYEPPMDSYPDFEASVEALRTILEHVPLGEDDTKRVSVSSSYDAATIAFATHLLSTCKGRSVLTTDEGFIGLGPKNTEPGDRVVVLLGCDVPLVLRDAPDVEKEKERFLVVGDCYVYGLMTGEALLGPLPRGVRVVITDSEDPEELTKPVFVGGDGTTTDGHDPRLERVRAELQDETKSEVSAEDILTPENLRRLGVDVVGLDLA